MNRLSKALTAILMIGSLSVSCGLIPVAEDVLAPLGLYVSTSGNDANDCLGPEPERACLTLRAALDKARTHLNSTINIGPGHYYVSEDPATPERAGRFLYELINGVTLIGAGRDQTIFHSNKGAYTFEAGSSMPVVIRALGINASNGAYGGIMVHARGEITIENCRVYNGRLGILVQDNGIARMTGSLIEMSQTGIQVLGGLAQVWNDFVISEHDTGVSIDRGGSADIMRSVIEKNVIGILNNGDLRLSATTLTHNTTSALVNNSGQAGISESTFDSNGYLDVRPSSRERGSTNPTISNRGEMNLRNSTISNNYGQAVLNNTAHIPHRDSDGNPIDTYEMILDRVQVIGNGNGNLDACAVVNNRGALVVTHSNIQDNECVGIDVYGGEAQIGQSSIIGNQIGIFARGESSVRAFNTTISRNNFGIEQVDGARLELVNVTVARQSTGLSSSFDPPANLVVVNSVILWCNAAVVGLGEFVCNASLTEDTLGLGPLTQIEASWFVEGSWLGPVGMWINPLLPGSPLIDAGFGCSLDTDQRGVDRPRSGCDVGAYEFQASSAIAPLEFVTPSGGVPGIIPLYTDTPQAPTPGLALLVLTRNANCRAGPGSVYESLDAFPQGQSLQVDGRNEQAPWWWQVIMPNSRNHCWISAVAGTPSGEPNGLQVIQAPPTPTPTIGPVDFDGDGYPAGKDCNDKDPKVHPGAPEGLNDTIDSNCNGDPNK